MVYPLGMLSMAPIIVGPFIGPLQSNMCYPQSTQEILDPMVGDFCNALPRKIAIKIQGATQTQQETLLKVINTVRASDPIIERYFDFVVSYLKGFSIFVAGERELMQYFPIKNHNQYANFAPATNTMQLTAEVIDKNPYLLKILLRHELRHAYWIALQHYGAGSDTYFPYCYSPINKANRNKVASAIKKGDARVDSLKKLLYRESHAQSLTLKEKDWLSSLRKTCSKMNSHYEWRIPIQVERKGVEMLANQIGKTFNIKDTEAAPLGDCKIISTSDESAVGITVELLDPLRRLIHTKEHAQQIMSVNYHTEHYPFEREAFLYGDTPTPLIREFYPELFMYTNKIDRRIMAFPHPSAMPEDVLRFSSLKDYAHASIERLLGDKAAFEAQITTGQTSQFIAQVALVIRNQYVYGTSFDKLRFALESLLNQGINAKDKAEVNRLLAKISDQENDGLGACRFYHRAFKQGADFSFDDYITCFENLTAHNQWHEAKLVCQKALAKYKKHYDSIHPSQVQLREKYSAVYLSELEEWRQFIGEKRH